jgi:branched-chain amino acid transport system ATP-binding protein
VSAGYGASVAIENVSFGIGYGGSLAVLGRNGVGKTSLLLTIMGLTRLHRGQILWQGIEIGRLPPHRRALFGIGWVAQEREIFPSLSVEENLTVAERPGPWGLDAVYDLFPRLAACRKTRGNRLPLGEQQMLAIARAMLTNPALLLLDEPFEGQAPAIVEELVRAIRRMDVDEGLAVILVEQNVEIALTLTDRAIVLEGGSIVHSAPSAELLVDPAALDRLIGPDADAV